VSTALDNVAVFPVPAQEEPEGKQRKKDNDGLHKRRGIWHFKLKVGGRWKEISTHTSNYLEARKYRTKTVQAQEEGRLPNDLAKWTFAGLQSTFTALERSKLLQAHGESISSV